MAYCLGGFAELARLEEDADLAARMLGASEHLFREIGVAVDPDEAQTQETIAAYAREQLGADRADELRAAGAGLAPEELAL